MKVTNQELGGKPMKELADLIDLGSRGVQVTNYQGEVILSVDSLKINAPRAVMDPADTEYLMYLLMVNAKEAREWQDTH